MVKTALIYSVVTIYLGLRPRINKKNTISGIGNPEKYVKAVEEAILALLKNKDGIQQKVYDDIVESYKMAYMNPKLQKHMEALYTSNQKVTVNTANLPRKTVHIEAESNVNLQFDGLNPMVSGDIYSHQ